MLWALIVVASARFSTVISVHYYARPIKKHTPPQYITVFIKRLYTKNNKIICLKNILLFILINSEHHFTFPKAVGRDFFKEVISIYLSFNGQVR